jgi:hypothetical protein
MTMSSDRRIDAQDMVDAMNELAEAIGAAKTLVRYINDNDQDAEAVTMDRVVIDDYVEILLKRFVCLSEQSLGVLDLIRFEVKPPSDQSAG